MRAPVTCEVANENVVVTPPELEPDELAVTRFFPPAIKTQASHTSLTPRILSAPQQKSTHCYLRFELAPCKPHSSVKTERHSETTTASSQSLSRAADQRD